MNDWCIENDFAAQKELAALEEYKELMSIERSKDFDRSLWLLKVIIDDLPQNRDWLNPDVEADAKEILKKIQKIMITLPSTEEFNFKDCTIAGDECWLITPKDMSVKWNDENARFRSCIVRKSDNFVVSQGFKKFTNFGEQPAFEPWDNSWKFEARHKIDGSLLIVSKYKGELIVRTRGTTDARQLPNGHEIDFLIKKYPKAFDNDQLNYGLSLLYEWTTPTNIIVLREHDEPTLTLVGGVNNEFAYYMQQFILDTLAGYIGVNRPKKYEYDSIEECILDVAAWRGKEGVVPYSPDGQTLKKIKADEYCELHKLATGIKNVSNVLDVFLESPKFVNFDDFYNHIETLLDFEIAEKCRPFIQQITDAYAKFVRGVEKMRERVEFIRNYATRKEQAAAIQEEFTGWKTSIAFLLLDNREIDDKVVRKAMEKILEL